MGFLNDPPIPGVLNTFLNMGSGRWVKKLEIGLRGRKRERERMEEGKRVSEEIVNPGNLNSFSWVECPFW
jgi:hypothetical protein